MRTFYPAFGGPTLGEVASAATDAGSTAPVNAASKGEVAQAAAIGATGNPLIWWVGLVLALVLLMFIVRWIGGEEAKSEFASIKLSAYNIVIIGLAATIWLAGSKAFFTRIKVPGLSTIVLAA